MPIKIFNQQDFLNSEDISFGLDFLAKPNEIVLAKDPKTITLNLDTTLERLISSKNILDSYGLDPMSFVSIEKKSRSETIDNALLALFFFINGEENKSKDIFQYYLMNLPPIFTAGEGQVPDWVNLEDNSKGDTQALSTAYLLYAASYYMNISGNTQYRQIALFCAQQLIDLKSLTLNLITDNYSSITCSSEANIIAYLGLKLLTPWTNNSDIINFTENLKLSISVDLGLKDNTSTANFSPISVTMAGLFALSIGDKFLLDSAKTFLTNYYISEDNRIVGIGNSQVDLKSTLWASIFYYRAEQPSFTYGFNSSMLEFYSCNQLFLQNSTSSSCQISLLFLVLNLIMLNSFIVEELFR